MVLYFRSDYNSGRASSCKRSKNINEVFFANFETFEKDLSQNRSIHLVVEDVVSFDLAT